MTFKKAEMAKTLKNGLIMIETNPLNHNWSHFVILSGLTLHQFQKKLLLSTMYLLPQKEFRPTVICIYRQNLYCEGFVYRYIYLFTERDSCRMKSLNRKTAS